VYSCRWPRQGEAVIKLRSDAPLGKCAVEGTEPDYVELPVSQMLATFQLTQPNEDPRATVAWRSDWKSAGGGAVDESLSRIWDRVREGRVDG
jgi:hypothetical protein